MKPPPLPVLQSTPAAAPKVSVVLPTHNRAHVLGRAIDSIRAQTLTDWELIVVDDGSTDETPSVMRHYCAKDSRIHYVRQPQGGQARAQNTGLRLARGEYLHHQDDDDVVYADKLAKCARFLDAQADCCAVSVRSRLYRGTAAKGWRLVRIGSPRYFFFRVASVRPLGGWNEFYQLFEDKVFIWKLSSNGRRISALGDILYDYFKSSDEHAALHRGLHSVRWIYRLITRAMHPLYLWGLPDMMQPHWGLRRAVKQLYFLRRHAFLPSACYAHWQTGMRAALARLSLHWQNWEKNLRLAAARPRFSRRIQWQMQWRVWFLSRQIGLPLRWRLHHSWSLARSYAAARRTPHAPSS